ncbi:MAG TPA: hypothetical protein VN285_06425 [Candidatus Deferrimicrobium sp.]|nr:hypothetical protein [Candidatus Deferrimicrobium sp.]
MKLLKGVLSVCALLLVGGCAGFGIFSARTPGTVYVVYCIDTEPNSFNDDLFSQRLNLSAFAPHSIVDQTFETGFRDSLMDSFGHPVIFTWFLMTTEAFRQTPEGLNAIPEIFLKHFRSKSSTFGDEIAWHYHHSDWYLDRARNRSRWNPLHTFSDSIYRDAPDRKLALDQLAAFIYLNRLYPAGYRAGWNWENTDFSNWLDSLIPFDYSNDWDSVADSVMLYHPSVDNLFKAGGLHRSIVRCVDRPDTAYVRLLFERAGKGENVILAHYTHNYGGANTSNNTLKARAQLMHGYLTRYSRAFGVMFKYCSASGAVNLLQRQSCPDTFALSVSWAPDERKVSAAFDDDVFGTPIVCYETNHGRIEGAFMTPMALSGGWEYCFSDSAPVRFVLAAVSTCGQQFITELPVSRE